MATKVTLKPADAAPSAQMAHAAEFNVSDALGRTITLRRPGVLAQYRLVEALGDTAENRTYMAMVLPIVYVSAVDAEPVLPPQSKLEVEALLQLLDSEGLAAVMAGMQEHFSPQPPAKRQEAVKKS